MLKQKIERIKSESIEKMKYAASERELYDIKVRCLGRNGILTKILKSLKSLSSKERRISGSLANQARRDVEDAYQKRRKELSKQIDWEKERIDVTLPGEKKEVGSLNPITLVQREIEKIFASLGFEIADGPEIETEWYNFDSLNVPPDHPARDMQDTFWLKSEKGKFVLRTHTSPVQVRHMQKNKPPIRIIVPGRVFRNEATDANHEHTFNQFEGLMVSSDVSAANFRSTMKVFFEEFFQQKIEIRLRPSYFPFTEPSFEIDMNCLVCGGKGCPVCKYSGWIEIAGAGMVNQKVFEAAGYAKNRYQGFAFGGSIDRLAMMKYKIDDIRLFQSGDLRFIQQF